MDEDLRQHKTWNSFASILGEFFIAYSWADKFITFLLHHLAQGEPNRGLVVLYGMGARTKVSRIIASANAYETADKDRVISFATEFQDLADYRNGLAHCCFEWNPEKLRFSISDFGEDVVPSMRQVNQPKQEREIHEKAVTAEKLTNRIYDLLIARDAVVALDPRRPRVVEIK